MFSGHDNPFITSLVRALHCELETMKGWTKICDWFALDDIIHVGGIPGLKLSSFILTASFPQGEMLRQLGTGASVGTGTLVLKAALPIHGVVRPW